MQLEYSDVATCLRRRAVSTAHARTACSRRSNANILEVERGIDQQVYARGVPEMRARCVGISAVDRISLGRRWRAKLLYPLRTTDMHRLFDASVTTRIATAILLTLRISIRLHHITLQGRHHAPHPTHRGRTAWSKGRDRRHRPSQRGTFAPNSFPSLHSAIFFWN